MITDEVESVPGSSSSDEGEGGEVAGADSDAGSSVMDGSGGEGGGQATAEEVAAEVAAALAEVNAPADAGNSVTGHVLPPVARSPSPSRARRNSAIGERAATPPGRSSAVATSPVASPGENRVSVPLAADASAPGSGNRRVIELIAAAVTPKRAPNMRPTSPFARAPGAMAAGANAGQAEGGGGMSLTAPGDQVV